jgi:hypothetical protein
MKYSRRDVIKLGGLAAISSLGLSGRIIGMPQWAQSDLLSSLGIHTFQPLIGTNFYVSAGKFYETVTLVSVKELSRITINGECFLLDFEIDSADAKQAVYQIFHPQIGNFEMLLVPGKDSGRNVITATINRI